MRAFRRFATAALVGLAACSDSTDSTGSPPNTPHAAASIAPASAAPLNGVVGTALADSAAVLVLDSAGAPLAGVVVGFQVTRGGGSVSPASAVTNAQGIARTQWVLGPDVSAPQTLYAEARTGVSTSLSATARVTESAVLTKVSGDGQSVPGSTPVTLVVELRQNGAPIQGAGISFNEETGKFGQVVTTDAQGRAAFTYGAMTTIGVQRVTASVASLVAGPTVTFTVTTITGPVTSITVSPADRTLDVGTVLPVTVTPRDAGGNAVPGTQVQISVDGGTAPSSVTTGANGSATFNWTMPTSTTPSSVHLTAKVSTVTGTGQVSLTSGPAVSIGTSPPSQTAAPNQEAFFTHDLRDQYGNRVINRDSGCGSIVWSVPAPATWRHLVGSLSSYIAVSSPESVTLTVTCGPLTGTGQLVIVP